MTRHALDPRLRVALRTAAEAEQEAGASPAVAAHLLAVVRSHRTTRTRRRQAVWLSAAAAAVIGVTVARWHIAPTSEATPPSTPASSMMGTPVDFLPLPYANVPTHDGQIMQISVPASALASFGLAPRDAAAAAVNAEVFVGEDGLARAVRFSPLSTKELVQ